MVHLLTLAAGTKPSGRCGPPPRAACKAGHVQQLTAPLCLQANLYPRILAAMKPGSTLGLSHGFLLGVMKNDDADFREDINVVLVAPKVGCL